MAGGGEKTVVLLNCLPLREGNFIREKRGPDVKEGYRAKAPPPSRPYSREKSRIHLHFRTGRLLRVYRVLFSSDNFTVSVPYYLPRCLNYIKFFTLFSIPPRYLPTTYSILSLKLSARRQSIDMGKKYQRLDSNDE